MCKAKETSWAVSSFLPDAIYELFGLSWAAMKIRQPFAILPTCAQMLSQSEKYLFTKVYYIFPSSYRQVSNKLGPFDYSRYMALMF